MILPVGANGPRAIHSSLRTVRSSRASRRGGEDEPVLLAKPTGPRWAFPIGAHGSPATTGQHNTHLTPPNTEQTPTGLSRPVNQVRWLQSRQSHGELDIPSDVATLGKRLNPTRT